MLGPPLPDSLALGTFPRNLTVLPAGPLPAHVPQILLWTGSHFLAGSGRRNLSALNVWPRGRPGDPSKTVWLPGQSHPGKAAVSTPAPGFGASRGDRTGAPSSRLRPRPQPVAASHGPHQGPGWEEPERAWAEEGSGSSQAHQAGKEARPR